MSTGAMSTGAMPTGAIPANITSGAIPGNATSTSATPTDAMPGAIGTHGARRSRDVSADQEAMALLSAQLDEQARKEAEEKAQSEKVLKQEQERMEAQLEQADRDGMPTEVKVGIVKDMYMRSFAAGKARDKELEALTLQRSQLAAQLQELHAENGKLFEDTKKLTTTMNELREAMETQQEALSGEPGTRVLEQMESFKRVQQRERELMERFKDHETQAAVLEQQLAAAHASIEQYRTRMAASEQASGQWAENIQMYTGWLSNENLQLRRHLNELSTQMLAQRTADAGRWTGGSTLGLTSRFQSLLTRPRATVSVLTTGTMDVGMDDAFDVDMPMPTAAEKHKTPPGIRANRRVGKTKTAAKRPGAIGPRGARPADCRKGFSERRAASTYLQYRDGRSEKQAMGALKPRGRKAGMARGAARKRTRLGTMLEWQRRIEAVTATRALPVIPRSLVRVAAEAYTKRADRELSALMMAKWNVDEKRKDAGVSTEDDGAFGKLITITKTVEPFIPRLKTFSGPMYLPKTPEALSKDERSHWSRITHTWTLGPAKKPKSKGENKGKSKGKAKEAKKHVRFADAVEFEPTLRLQQKVVYEPWDQDDSTFRWSHLIIAILLVLLMLSHFNPDGRVWSWQEANERPEDIVARLRVPGPGDARVPVLDFEVGKVSDVDAGLLG
ncbi:uncharacterized protein DSM5745_06950 [Aspergillus mulundensis]|uniref:Uncharacterized protein n=1 Tax=Aspergillus mulundensis TaxID=1810919 RepID=A0A3D8RK25_9EURO|nr:hypothetical protein DSM5745_06950 [Aspergillus mulundensis]RDW74288.1 hypothetical protein DSM5745_06950 [Aspergillus mulundensis]